MVVHAFRPVHHTRPRFRVDRGPTQDVALILDVGLHLAQKPDIVSCNAVDGGPVDEVTAKFDPRPALGTDHNRFNDSGALRVSPDGYDPSQERQHRELRQVQIARLELRNGHRISQGRKALTFMASEPENCSVMKGAEGTAVGISVGRDLYLPTLSDRLRNIPHLARDLE